MYAGAGTDAYLDLGFKDLSRHRQSASYNLVLTEETDNLEVVVKYNGQGALLVKNIEIKPDMTSLWESTAIVLYLCVLIDLFVLFYRKKKWPQTVLLVEA